MTGETIVDPARWPRHLVEVARTGIATEHDEALLGESSLAPPVFDATGAAVGADRHRGPSHPTGHHRHPLHDDVREAARNISRELGAPAWPVYPPSVEPASA